MITAGALDAMRKAATLAAVAPAVRVRIRDGGRTVIEVRRPPFDDDTSTIVAPCAFHRSVSCAYRMVCDGHDLEFVGFEGGGDPQVDIGVRSGDQALPGGIYRFTLHGRWTHVLPTTMRQEQVVAVLRDRGIESPQAGADDLPPIAVHRDDDTDVLLLHLSCDIGDEETSATMHDLLEQVLACCSVADLLGTLGLADALDDGS